MKNDSYSLLSQTGWDDLRTYGMYYGLSFKRWAFEMTTDSLTNRSYSIATSGRIDQLSVALSRQFLNYERYPLNIGLSAGLGSLLLGNLGGSSIQNKAHAIFAPKLDIPQTYDTVSDSRMFLFNIFEQATYETSLIPITLFSSLEIGHTSFFRIGQFLETNFSNSFLGVRLSLGYQWSQNYESYGQTFSTTLRSETGPYLGAFFTAGFLETGFLYNPVNTRQAGYVALSWLEGSDGSHKKTGDSLGIQAIEFRIAPLMAGVRLRQSILEGPIVFSAVLGAESGPFMESTMIIADDEHYRYQQIYLGLDLTSKIFTWMDMYGLVCAGPRQDIWTSNTILATVIYDERKSAVFFAEGGIRAYLPTKEPHSYEWGIGSSAAILFIDAFETGVRPVFQIYLIGSTGR